MFWRFLPLFCLLMLTACGPEPAGQDEQTLTSATQRIAQEYQANRNLEMARAQLNELDVANPLQWLIYTTETRIKEGADAPLLAALVKLTQDLGLQSKAITEYATANNLLPAIVALPTPTAAQLAPIIAKQKTTTTTLTHTQSVQSVATTAVVTAGVAVTSAADSVIKSTTTLSPTVATNPLAKATDPLNVRSGPGTGFPLLSALQASESVPIVGKNPAGDWWQVQLANGQVGWVFTQLVTVAGETAGVAVAANIPAEPATSTPAPIAQEPTATPAPPATAPSDPNAQPYFALVSRRLWSKAENGDCRGQHLLRIHVLDANGVQLNGVRLKGIYIGEELVTGDQGKGDGIIEYDLHGSGEGFMVIRNNDGREATSDRAEGFTTRSLDIDEGALINAGYCSNHEDCQVFYSSYGCQGHHSWEAVFKRNY
jgi:uncharacterized protein YraI